MLTVRAPGHDWSGNTYPDYPGPARRPAAADAALLRTAHTGGRHAHTGYLEYLECLEYLGLEQRTLQDITRGEFEVPAVKSLLF